MIFLFEFFFGKQKPAGLPVGYQTIEFVQLCGCGGDPIQVFQTIEGRASYDVRCVKCGNATPYSSTSPDEALRLWNRYSHRSPPPSTTIYMGIHER